MLVQMNKKTMKQLEITFQEKKVWATDMWDGLVDFESY